jgi:hypothetical protein
MLVVSLAGPGPAGSGSDAAGARTLVDSAKGEMFIDLAPVDLPAHASHHEVVQPPVAILTLPAAGSLYGFRVAMVDSAGGELPSQLVHHFNLIDPDHRELFLPISRRMAAAGKETGAMTIPWVLFGFPVNKGERVLASVMLDNPTDASYRQARARLVLYYIPAGRPWPLFRAAPFQMDVAFPVGDKSFDLPPGRSSHSYEGSPAVAGKIVAIGGHVHEHAERLEFLDVTTGAIIYRASPVTDSTGDIIGVPVERLYGWTRLGVHIVPAHRYRVTVYYDNPTSKVIPDGGMGVVGGLFVPDGGVVWPATDVHDSLYQQDLRHAMRLGGGHDMMMMSMPAHGAGHHAH